MEKKGENGHFPLSFNSLCLSNMICNIKIKNDIITELEKKFNNEKISIENKIIEKIENEIKEKLYKDIYNKLYNDLRNKILEEQGWETLEKIDNNINEF